MTNLQIIPLLQRTILPICFLCIFTVVFLQLTSKRISLQWLVGNYAENDKIIPQVTQSPRCFWPYYLHGYHSASSADNNVQMDIYNIEHLYYNSDTNITDSVELRTFHYSLSPDSLSLLNSQSNLFDDCLSTIKYQQLLLISLRQHKYCQLHFNKYNTSQLCALHNARLNSLSTYLPTHFNELISPELTGPKQLNFLLNTYPYPKSKYFKSSESQNSLFISDPDTIIAVYTSSGMWPMTKVWLFNIIKYQPYLLPRIVIGCYDYAAHEQVMEFNKKLPSIKIAQMKAKDYPITSIQSLWKNIYKNFPNLFIHPKIIDQFVSNLVWNNQILPSFVISRLSPLNLSSDMNTKTGHIYLSPEYTHMVWGKVTNSHRAVENGFTIIIHDTDEFSYHDPTEWITPKSWLDDYTKFICDYQFEVYNTGLVLLSHYNQPVLKWWHGMEINSLNPKQPTQDQHAMSLLLHPRKRSIRMDYNGSLITAAAIEKSRFEFRLIQRLNVRIKAKQKLKTERNKALTVINDGQIFEFILRNPHLLKEYQLTFADTCSNHVSEKCFYSGEKITLSKSTQRPKEIENFLFNQTVLNKTASDYLQTFSHLFIHSNFSTYSFFNSPSEFVQFLSLYPSTNRNELAWCPPESEGISRCNNAISTNWGEIRKSIEAGTLLSYHYNCLASYDAKVNAMKSHGNWIEL